MARLVIEDLSKRYTASSASVDALSGLNLAVAPGECLVLLGPSGSGKTTTLRLIAGLEEPTRGSISLDGQPLAGVPSQARDVGLMFQDPALFPHLTVFENMALGLRLRRAEPRLIEERVRTSAEWLGLSGLLRRRPHTLSGGERQRVALGRTLVRRPKVLLLDEPLSNLDPPRRAQLRAMLRQVRAQLRTTILHVTHDQAEAQALGDRVAVLRSGVLQQVAEPRRLYHAPANLFVAGFVGSPPMNFFRGTIRRQDAGWCFRASSSNDGPPSLVVPIAASSALHLERYLGQAVILGVRPEHLHLEPVILPGDVTFPATVEALEPLGADTLLHLRTSHEPCLARVSNEPTVAPDQTLRCGFSPDQCLLFDAVTEQSVSQSATNPNPPEL
jgi:multiple sugar transport system ATP-binding protein